MTRDQIILLLQPYKNGLMPKKTLADAVGRFLQLLCAACEKYPRLKFNVAMPGYILECADKLSFSRMRDAAKRGSVEWVCMGYTEPFISFSPHRLTGENIALGAQTLADLTGDAPLGFVAPFSNWEPSHIDILNSAGLQYVVLSNELLERGAREKCGYWITEYTGCSAAIFPCRSYSPRKAPASIMRWIKETFPAAKPNDAARLIILKYLYPLEEDAANANEWIEKITAEIDKHILELQPLRFKDVLASTPPLGLQYVPSSLVQPHGGPAEPYFLNKLHCYDQISVMQRKLMDVCDGIGELADHKKALPLKKKLFFAQDINRFLHSEKSGFGIIADRLWTYGKLIDVERELYLSGEAKSGVIRLAEYLRNGYKSVMIANKALKLFIDHKFGAQVYGLDFSEASYSACAGYNAKVGDEPRVLSPRESRLAFRDKVYITSASRSDIAAGKANDCANFADSQFEYVFKNSPLGVKVLLNCTGGFIDGERHCPLSIDKVFSLEKDSASLTFSYKLSNPTLAGYAFTFAIELPLAMPGISNGSANVTNGGKKQTLAKDTITLEETSEWTVEDNDIGVRMEYVTQKKSSVFFRPLSVDEGVIMSITFPVELEKNSSVSLTGAIRFKKITAKGDLNDTL